MFNTVLYGFGWWGADGRPCLKRTGVTFSLCWGNALCCLGTGGLLVSHCTVVETVFYTCDYYYVYFRLSRRKNKRVFETYQAIITHTGNSQLELIHEIMWIMWKKWGSQGNHCGCLFLLECGAMYTVYVRIKVFEERCFFISGYKRWVETCRLMF